MKVKDLIAELQRHPPEDRVKVRSFTRHKKEIFQEEEFIPESVEVENGIRHRVVIIAVQPL